MTGKDHLTDDNDAVALRALAPEAKRALEEAEARRKQRDRHIAPARPTEVGGREGLDPTRFGDWEKGGIASDF